MLTFYLLGSLESTMANAAPSLPSTFNSYSTIQNLLYVKFYYFAYYYYYYSTYYLVTSQESGSAPAHRQPDPRTTQTTSPGTLPLAHSFKHIHVDRLLQKDSRPELGSLRVGFARRTPLKSPILRPLMRSRPPLNRVLQRRGSSSASLEGNGPSTWIVC